jgi:Zn-dependent metalloprotease
MDRGRPNRQRDPLLCIVPPYLLAHLARLAEPRLRRVAEAAMRTLAVSERFRGQRVAIGEIAPLATTPAGDKRRTIYDARRGGDLPGHLVRGEGDPPGSDATVNESYDGLGATYDLFFDRFGRRSIDDRGMRLDATVHYRRSFNNAFWNGRQMVFGDGDGVIFRRFTRSVDVIGHELTHGITQFEAGLEYFGESGALNEHVSDVFGALVKQHVRKETADQADWLIGAELFAPGVQAKALRSMKEPGTAYDDPRLGQDPQPGHMRDYVETEDDNGGVHINSGIPNRAFALTALRFGGPAWAKAGKVWYLALRDLLGAQAKFVDAAATTTEIAAQSLGADAAEVVRDAWRAVGVRPRAKRAPRTPPAPAGGRKDGRPANSNRRERRVRRTPARARG